MWSLLPNLASLERLTGYSWTLCSHSEQTAAVTWKIFTPIVPISITAGHSHDHSCLIYLIQYVDQYNVLYIELPL